jgi:putative ABC transport system ATP-binding protein
MKRDQESQPIMGVEEENENECALIKLRSVSKIYKTDAGNFPALKNIDLCFGAGEFVSIMGKSGSGKSTLINMITGIDHPTDGTVRVGGASIHEMNEGELAVWRGRTMGVVFQFFQLLPMLSVLENTMLPMDFCNVYERNEREERAIALLEMLDLKDVADDLPSALSGGQQQIAALARALANDPPIIVADEPTGNLDSRTAEHILDIFADLATTKGKTIIIVTHDPDLGRRTQRQVILSDGELIDENIVRAFPTMPHPQMLHLTRKMEARSFDPGVLIAHIEDARGLYLVAQGEVEVLRNGHHRPPIQVGSLCPGEYFSEGLVEVFRKEHISFKASMQGQVKVLWLDPETLRELAANGQALDGRLNYNHLNTHDADALDNFAVDSKVSNA